MFFSNIFEKQIPFTTYLGAVRPWAAGLFIGIEGSIVRDSALMYLTSVVTTRIGVELVVIQGNYLIQLR